MNEKTLEGYHATTIKRSEIILKDGFKISKSNADTWEWLGDGVYFWEDDYYAVQWNVIDIEKNKTNLNEYAKRSNFNQYDEESISVWKTQQRPTHGIESAKTKGYYIGGIESEQHGAASDLQFSFLEFNPEKISKYDQWL